MVPAFAEEHARFNLVTEVGQTRRPHLDLALADRTGGFTAPPAIWGRDTPELVSRLKPDVRCEGSRRKAGVRLDIDPHRRTLKPTKAGLGGLQGPCFVETFCPAFAA